jgi:D-alanyl-lipoteichoic acid acyltransferase DltB (MBOAT superfamily)
VDSCTQKLGVLFASPTFLFGFLPLCVAFYLATPGVDRRNAVLLAASWLFYAWGEPVFVVLLMALTVLNHRAALAISERKEPQRKRALAGAVALNLACLGVFKYADFAAASLNWGFGGLGVKLPAPNVPLPLGISFFTFHALSYLIDVYRGRVSANRSFLQIALYLAFFPQLIAGPIVRYRSIAPRLRKRRMTLGRASAGARIFVIGLAQKLVIADAVAPLAEAVFDHARRPGLAEAWLGVSAYTLQIYFDFAGYSLMAIGLGLVFGFRLPRNFRRPYASRSITEFWRRWHISLSTWFRDYLYIPLGGNRGPAWKTARNLITVFLLCGLWHGASWTFVLWGAWHGGFLILERLGLKGFLRRLPGPLAWAYAMAAVMGGWVLFRSGDLARAVDLWSGLAGGHGFGQLSGPTAMALTAELRWLMPLAALLAIFGLPRLKRAQAKAPGPAWIWADNAAVTGLAALSLLQVASGTYSPFLYFRF